MRKYNIIAYLEAKTYER